MKWSIKIAIVTVVIAALWVSFSLGRKMPTSTAREYVDPDPVIECRSELPRSPHLRWIKNDDGTYSVFKLQDKNLLIKRVIKPDGHTIFIVRYQLDVDGRALCCKIKDADGKAVYRVSFGYRMSDGKLVEERVYRDGEAAAKEILCRIIYSGDTEKIPKTRVVNGGENALDDHPILGVPFALVENPFADQFPIRIHSPASVLSE